MRGQNSSVPEEGVPSDALQNRQGFLAAAFRPPSSLKGSASSFTRLLHVRGACGWLGLPLDYGPLGVRMVRYTFVRSGAWRFASWKRSTPMLIKPLKDLVMTEVHQAALFPLVLSFSLIPERFNHNCLFVATNADKESLFMRLLS